MEYQCRENTPSTTKPIHRAVRKHCAGTTMLIRSPWAEWAALYTHIVVYLQPHTLKSRYTTPVLKNQYQTGNPPQLKHKVRVGSSPQVRVV